MAQLSMEEREVVSQMFAAGHARIEIAERLGRARSTIGRELQRNSQADGSYSAVRAQQKAAARRRERPIVGKLQRPERNAVVRAGLAREWSPDQISGRLKRTRPANRRWGNSPNGASMRCCFYASLGLCLTSIASCGQKTHQSPSHAFSQGECTDLLRPGMSVEDAYRVLDAESVWVSFQTIHESVHLVMSRLTSGNVVELEFSLIADRMALRSWRTRKPRDGEVLFPVSEEFKRRPAQSQ